MSVSFKKTPIEKKKKKKVDKPIHQITNIKDFMQIINNKDLMQECCIRFIVCYELTQTRRNNNRESSQLMAYLINRSNHSASSVKNWRRNFYKLSAF